MTQTRLLRGGRDYPIDEGSCPDAWEPSFNKGGHRLRPAVQQGMERGRRLLHSPLECPTTWKCFGPFRSVAGWACSFSRLPKGHDLRFEYGGEISALIGDPGRANMLVALLSGRARPRQNCCRRRRFSAHGKRTFRDAHSEPYSPLSSAKAGIAIIASPPDKWPACWKPSWRFFRETEMSFLARHAASIRPFARPGPVTTTWPAASASLLPTLSLKNM